MAICAIIVPLKTALLGIKTWCAKNTILHTILIISDLRRLYQPNIRPR